MLSLCTVPLNACGISTNSAQDAQNSNIWNFVVARLASMRVNECSNAVKTCLQSQDRCGTDYAQCIGLDTDTIIHMCPEDLLVSCKDYESGLEQESTGNATEDFYTKLEPMIQGIILNIDNSLLDTCQKAADEAMIRVCGNTENCDDLTVDGYIGANTLKYEVEVKVPEEDEAGDGTEPDTLTYTDISQISDELLGRSVEGFSAGDDSLFDNTMLAMSNNAETSNPVTIKITGQIPWDKIYFEDVTATADMTVDKDGKDGDVVLRYNGGNVTVGDTTGLDAAIVSELNMLAKSIQNAINTIEADTQVQYCINGRTVQGMNVVDRGSGDIVGRFENLTGTMRGIIARSAIAIARENYNEKLAELEVKQQQDYVELQERIARIKGENLDDARREAARIACVGVADSAAMGTSKGRKNISTKPTEEHLIGSKSVNDWNYKETVTSTFNWETMVCHRCTRVQNCEDPKTVRKICKSWQDPVETCVDIQL